jgi:hypothetical protein
MAAGWTTKLWEIEDIVALVEAEERKGLEAGAMKRGKYRAKNPDPHEAD